jgi:hypothetical protein
MRRKRPELDRGMFPSVESFRIRGASGQLRNRVFGTVSDALFGGFLPPIFVHRSSGLHGSEETPAELDDKSLCTCGT